MVERQTFWSFLNGLSCTFSTSRPCTNLSQSYEEFAVFGKNGLFSVKFVQGLDVIKVHERPFKKLQNVWRSTQKVSMLYEQYFLYFLRIENKATSYVCNGRLLTFEAHCRWKSFLVHEHVSKLTQYSFSTHFGLTWHSFDPSKYIYNLIHKWLLWHDIKSYNNTSKNPQKPF